MNTKTALVAWNGETYTGAGETYDWLLEQTEYTEDLDPDQILRLAIFAYNGGWSLVPEDLGHLIAQEEEAFFGEFDSEADFAEHVGTEIDVFDQEGMPSWIVIDWQASYDRNLRHDFFDYDVIDIDGNYRKFFWNANV